MRACVRVCVPAQMWPGLLRQANVLCVLRRWPISAFQQLTCPHKTCKCQTWSARDRVTTARCTDTHLILLCVGVRGSAPAQRAWKWYAFTHIHQFHWFWIHANWDQKNLLKNPTIYSVVILFNLFVEPPFRFTQACMRTHTTNAYLHRGAALVCQWSLQRETDSSWSWFDKHVQTFSAYVHCPQWIQTELIPHPILFHSTLLVCSSIPFKGEQNNCLCSF